MSYLDVVMGFNPLTFHRLRDTPSNGGALDDMMNVQDMTFQNPTTLVQDPLTLPAYDDTTPNTLEFPSTQASSNRVVGSTNSIWDRGSATRPWSAFMWAQRPTTPSTNFPVVWSLGSSANNGVAPYFNKLNGNLHVLTHVGAVQTDTNTGWPFPAGSLQLIHASWNGTSLSIGSNGTTRSSINPGSWTNGAITAQLRPGTYGGSAHWEGIASDLVFYGTALSDANFTSIYDAAQVSAAGGGGTVESPYSIKVADAWVDL